MHLKTVTLNNFRCFDSITLELHPRLTVFVAANGGGKTSLLDGIAVGLTKVLHGLTSANQRLSGPAIRDTDFHLISHKDSKGVTNWTYSDYAQVILETTEGKKWDHWRPASKGKQPPSKIGLGDLNYLGEVLDSLKTTKPRNLPVFAYYGTSRGEVDVPKRLPANKSQNYGYPTYALSGALDAFADFKEILKWFDSEESSELRANKEAKGDDYLPFPALELIRETVDLILRGDYTNPRFNRRHKFVVSAKNGPDELQIEQLSQGYQSMLALSLDFSRRLALANPNMDYILANNSPSLEEAYAYMRRFHADGLENLRHFGPTWAPAIMLIDEVDLHLHPSWQQRVLGDLMRAFPHTQFIVTTHSPQVVSTVPTECLRILKDGKVYAAPAGTDGAEAQRMLKSVFGVNPRPDTEMSRALRRYMDLVHDKKWDTEEALKLRKKLDAWSKGEEPRLVAADLEIENQKWEASQ